MGSKPIRLGNYFPAYRPMIYHIAIPEYFNLYRSGAVPNTWRCCGQDGAWYIIQNYYYPHITARILPKHLESAFGIN